MGRVADTAFPAATHVGLAVVFQVRDGLPAGSGVATRARPVPRGVRPSRRLSAEDESLEESITRHLATKVDIREVAHIEQLGTWSDPKSPPAEWQVVTAYLGLVATDLDPALPQDTSWRPVDDLPPLAFDHRARSC